MGAPEALARSPRVTTAGATQPVSGIAISPAEWVWVAAMTLFVLLLTQIPATAERLVGPSDRVHVGSYWYAGDFSQYLASMREGATTSSWLVHNHFSAEPHDPVFMYPLYVVLGKLSAATGLPLLPLYSVLEILMRLALPASLYLFFAALLPQASTRRFAFVLAAFSGGLGIFLGLGEALTATAPLPSDGKALNTFVETVTFGTFMAAPHVGIGLALTLLSIVCFAAACRGARHALGLLTADVLLLAVLHPFNLPVLLSTFGVFSLLHSMRERRLAWRPILATAAAGVVGTPILLYNFVTFSFAPFWSQTYGAQNLMPSPRPWELPIDYGIVLLAAPLGVLVLRRGATLEQRLLLTWLAVGLIWMYVPVPYQRRFAFGLQPALAALAALGWPLLRPAVTRGLTRLGVAERLRSPLALRLTQYPLLLLGFVTSLASFLVIVSAAATNQPLPIYLLDRDTYAVGEWIAERTGADDVIAGSFNTGNILAGVLPGRVLIGYPVATLGAPEKRQTIEALYRGDLSSTQAVEFLAANRVDYVIVGPEERKLGANDPGSQLGLSLAVQIGRALAYRFPPQAP